MAMDLKNKIKKILLIYFLELNDGLAISKKSLKLSKKSMLLITLFIFREF